MRETMKSLLFAALAIAVLSACTTVLRKDLLQTGARNVSFGDLQANPEAYKGKLFILGGTIIDTMPAANGTLIEALYVPVDASGYLKHKSPDGRFMALYQGERTGIDSGRRYSNTQITLAGVFIGIQQTGREGKTGLGVPAFRIEQIYLWPTDSYYTYYNKGLCGPGPYRGPYWGPYWGPPWWPHLYPLC